MLQAEVTSSEVASKPPAEGEENPSTYAGKE